MDKADKNKKRDPKRIDKILERLRDYWHSNPDLRLSQIIVDAAQSVVKQPAPSVFYREDSEFMDWLKGQKITNPPPRITATGVISGDNECWCLLVTKDDFVRLCDREPQEFDTGPFAKEGSPYQYQIYPSDLGLRREDDEKNPVTIRVEVTKP